MDAMTVGEVARHFGVESWHVARIIDRGFVKPAGKIGVYRVLRKADLPKVEAALRKAGYLEPAVA